MSIKPDFLEAQELSDVLLYLDGLRELNIIDDVFDAMPFVKERFGFLTPGRVEQIALYWIETFRERNFGATNDQ